MAGLGDVSGREDVRMSSATDELGQLWEWFGHHQFRGYSPLYERIAEAVAADQAVLDLVGECPPEAHLPPALLGAVHYLLLDGLDHPLADVYAGRSADDPAPLFLEVCQTHRDELSELLAFRRVQTNDCGRSALIGPGLTWIADRLDTPFALIDVGASAGLNLLCDRYRLDYGDHGSSGPADSPVVVACEVLGGRPPVAERLPTPASRVGIDRSPVDLADPADARWLLACVWPDTGRLARTEASIRLAQADLPTVLEGDAVDGLPPVIERLEDGTAAVVVTSWSFAYLSLDQRRRFTELLADTSRRRPVAWLSADGAGTFDGVGDASLTDRSGAQAHVLGAVLFEDAVAHPTLLAVVQQHGGWIDWRAPVA
jgi:hypothetical protein